VVDALLVFVVSASQFWSMVPMLAFCSNSRLLRQVDSLPPLLFTLAIKVLSQMLKETGGEVLSVVFEQGLMCLMV